MNPAHAEAARNIKNVVGNSIINDIKRESGNVNQLVDIAEKYIKNNINWRVELDGSIQRKEIPEIPMDAVREALVNSFCYIKSFVFPAKYSGIFVISPFFK